MPQAANSTIQNYIGTGLLGVAAAPTESFLPNTVELSDIMTADDPDKDVLSSRVEEAFNKDLSDLTAAVKSVTFRSREQVLDGVKRSVTYATVCIGFAADSTQESQVDFAYTYGQPGSAIGSMPIATKSTRINRGKISFSSGKGTPTVTYQQPFLPASLAWEYGVQAEYHYNGPMTSTDVTKNLKKILRDAIHEVVPISTDEINNDASHALWRLLEFQEVKYIRPTIVLIFLRDHAAANILKEMGIVVF
ncbi:TPA: hypothetical protein ACH3X1_000847 [Trebouxia sp. C0004]